ncbi:hypothetical protein FBUS_02288 [Fasciolopsis buskii]|uniref:Uncharacterized protein n=1 Tax=Fasciolopsis buskii TaxID=27845 RepID=A0A8E0S1U4_9TREM|nr:hypothetical protein FBUS_02288 [Fasciolopsis buski]
MPYPCGAVCWDQRKFTELLYRNRQVYAVVLVSRTPVTDFTVQMPWKLH